MLELFSELDTPHSCHRNFAPAAPTAWIVLSPDDIPIPSHFPLNITSAARPPLDTLPKVINPMPPTFSNSFSYFAFHSHASVSNIQLITLNCLLPLSPSPPTRQRLLFVLSIVIVSASTEMAESSKTENRVMTLGSCTKGSEPRRKQRVHTLCPEALL